MCKTSFQQQCSCLMPPQPDLDGQLLSAQVGRSSLLRSLSIETMSIINGAKLMRRLPIDHYYVRNLVCVVTLLPSALFSSNCLLASQAAFSHAYYMVPATYAQLWRFVPAGIKWAIVLLVILNLLQLNLLYFSSQGSTRCILKAALATRSAAEPAVARSKSDTAAATTLPGNPLGSTATGTVSRQLTQSEV